MNSNQAIAKKLKDNSIYPQRDWRVAWQFAGAIVSGNHFIRSRAIHIMRKTVTDPHFKAYVGMIVQLVVEAEMTQKAANN